VTAAGAQRGMPQVRFLMNRRAARNPYTANEAKIVSIASSARALHEMRTWPGYCVSPLWDLPGMARQLGVASLNCKDETHRFGLGSFKALGGAYAAGLALARQTSAQNPPTLCCATDGNHGRSVAYAARRHGCRCVIFVHEHALESKLAPMQALGAEVIRVAGSYDDSVDYAKRIATEKGWMLISDTSGDVSDPVAAEIMQGYGIMILEAADQLSGRLPTHVFVQAGVGGLAAAVAGCFADRAAADRPAIIVVEPEAAACVMASAEHQRSYRIAGDLNTNMAMLSCGETSAPAWAILQRRADAFMAVSDEAAAEAAASMACSPDIPEGLAITPSAAAGLAGVIAAAQDPAIASRLDLNDNSRVLIFATEGVELTHDKGT
jgi:diaminopropionate ammonia-lyase